MKIRLIRIRLIMILFSSTLFFVSTVVPGFTAGKSQAPEIAGLKGVKSLQEEIAKNPLKPPDTSSPRATLKSFLDNANGAYHLTMAAHQKNLETTGLFTTESVQQMERQAEQFFQRAVTCLNLQDVSEALKRREGIEGALFLKEIFDRIELPPFEEIPDARALEAERESKKIGGPLRWRVPNTKIFITLAEEGPRRGEFLFAPEIISRLDEFVEQVKHLPYKTGPSVSPGFLHFYDSHLGGLVPAKWSLWTPSWLNTMFLFNTILQWVFMVGLLLVTLLLFWACYRWWNQRAHRFSAVKWTWGRAVIILVGAAAILLDLYTLTEPVGLSGPVLVTLNLALRTIFWFMLARAAYLFGMAVGETIIASPKIDSRGIHASLVRASSGFIGVVAAAIIIFHGLSSLGVSLIPLITGLGVGGARRRPCGQTDAGESHRRLYDPAG